MRCKQECIPVGCIPSAAVAVSVGVCLGRGCLPWESVCLGRGCLARGCLPRHPPVNRITGRYRNITFPQLMLRMVKMHCNQLPLKVKKFDNMSHYSQVCMYNLLGCHLNFTVRIRARQMAVKKRCFCKTAGG